jgi:outer membrane autotransporter protein
VYGAAVAASFLSVQAAAAACSITGAVSIVQCDGTLIYARPGVGSGTLTVSDANVSAGLQFLPLAGAGAYVSVLNLTGNTTISRDDYPAILMDGAGLGMTSWDVTVNIAEGVTITADMAPGATEMGAVFINVKSAGDVLINNAGSVTYRTTADQTSGAIYGNTDVGDTTIINSGTVLSDGRGLYADTNDGSSSITNSGTVTAYTESMRANARAGDIILLNSGTVTSDARSAVVGWVDVGNVTITNTGTASSNSAAALLAWSVQGLAKVTNSGTLNTNDTTVPQNGDTYDHSGIWAYAETSGNVEVTNLSGGRISASAGYGIQGLADNGTVSIDNYGLITSAGGILAVSTLGNATVTNDGTIVATGAATPTAVELNVGNTGTFTNTGIVLGGFVTHNNSYTLSNSGTWWLLSGQTAAGATMSATSGTWAVGGSTVFNNSGLFGVDLVGGQATLSGFLEKYNLAGGTLRLASGANLTMSGALFENHGTIDLANGAADNTITTANFNSSAGSLLKVDVDDSGHSDRIVATNSVDISGGVAVNLVQGDYSVAKTYTLVQTTPGQIYGAFTGLTKDFTYFDTSLSYTTSTVDLNVQRNGLTLAQGAASVGGGSNAVNAASAIETLSSSDPLYWAALQLTTDEAKSVYGQLSGDANASYLTGIAADSHYVRDATVNRLRQAFGDIGAAGGTAMGYGEGGPVQATPLTPFAVWTQGFGSVAHSEDDNAGREFRRTLGTALGADAFVPFGDQVWRVGLAGSYARSAARIDERNASADIDAYSGMLYAGTEFGPWALRLGAAGTWNRIDSTRRIVAGGIDETLTSDSWARTWQGFGELGYRTKVAGIAAEPFVGLSYVVVDSDDVTERGSTMAVAIDGATQDAFYSTAGLRLQRDFGTVALNGSAAWRHGFGDLSSNVTARFLAGGDSFTIQGVDTGADTALLSAGMTFKLAPNSTAGLTYDGAFGSDGTEHGGRAEVRVRF